MQVVCMTVVTSSNVASPKFSGAKHFWFVQGTACQSTKWQDILEIWKGPWPPSPLAMPMVTRKKWKERTVAYLPDVQSSTDKSSQQRKTARHCRTLLKSNIVSIGCYIWLLLTRLPANRDCLLKLYMLVKPAGTASCEFYWEKRVYVGLTSYG